jgi:tetratricopeptide (TPR) repeat protein
MRPIAALIVLAMGAAVPSFAAVPSSDDIKTCLMNGEGNVIPACTALIGSQKYAAAELSEIYGRRGSARFKARQYQPALEDFDSALAILPGNPQLLLNRSLAHAGLAQFDAALQDIGKAIALRPEEPGFLLLRAGLMEQLKNHEAALADIAKAMALNPNLIAPYAARAQIYLHSGQYDLALADADKAVLLSPKNANYLMARGDIYVAMGQFERGLEDQDKAVAMAPENPVFLNDRCYSLGQWNQRLDQAMTDCKKALALAPGTPSVMDSLAFVYFRKGDLVQAAANYDATLAANPKSASSLYMRGILKLKRNDASGSDDIAAAKAIDGKTAELYARLGIVPAQ